MAERSELRPGRGAASNPAGRFESQRAEAVDDGWGILDEPLPRLLTTVRPEPARHIITRNKSPDIPFSQSINPYRGCEHGCVYCLDGDTPILYADGSYRALKYARAGDSIFGTVSDGRHRRYVETRISNHWSTIKPAYRILLADGRELIASRDHRFLTEGGWKFVTGPHSGRDQRPHLTFNDRLVGTGDRADRVDDLTGYALIAVVGGIEGHQRHAYSGEARTIPGRYLKAKADLRVACIEPLGLARRMYDITTGTGDFIANGVVSHNCYARPSHAYVDLSPGLDFETKLFYKEGAVDLLRRELAAKSYQCSPIAFGANTDPYQPIERKYRVTRSLLELLSECDHPATVVTKGAALIARDIDLLASMAARRLVAVFVSITTLDADLKRTLEPRAASPASRLRIIEKLSKAGVPVGVMVAPVIPVLTDHEAENILEAAAAAGATGAGHVMLRLPHEVAPLFKEWLAVHEPLKAEHVLSRIRDLRGGRENDPRFGSRMRGEGKFAELFKQRFSLAKRRLGLDRKDPRFDLDTTRFRPPAPPARPPATDPESPQQSLF